MIHWLTVIVNLVLASVGVKIPNSTKMSQRMTFAAAFTNCHSHANRPPRLLQPPLPM
ncbi:MAG: hypothetical protein QM785_10450 [Pyrinomonadaceae bacterium]